MKIAVIDMGTNTFHLILVNVSYEQFKIIYRERVAVKIGKNGISKGLITPEAEVRAIEAIRHFKEEIDKNGIKDVYATATSAIRNAKNGEEILERIRKETGISAKIISGLEEAEYIYYGVTSALEIGDEPALIMDIGGGSIEYIIANDDQIFWLQSYEMGGQRMIDKFHDNDPISNIEIKALEDYLQHQMTELVDACNRYRPATLIGCSGSFETISDIALAKKGLINDPDKTELPFDLGDFDQIFNELISKNRAERLKIAGMIPMRVEMIVVAMILIKFIFSSLGIKQFRISSFALKEGVLLKTINTLKKEKVLKPNSL